MNTTRTDILIVGGGMVGASLANALASLPVSVAVVEATPPRSPGQPSYDDRSTALAWGSRRIFETLGLWDALRRGATPIHEIHVSDRGRFGATRLARDEHGVEALGYVVENRTLGQALWGALQRSDVALHCPARVVGVETGANAVCVTVDCDGEQSVCEARLLVVADGARSATRDLLGVSCDVTDYGQVALIANVTPGKLHRNVAYERFTDSGPLAMLPLSNGRCSVVWTLAPAHAPEIAAFDERRFLCALQDAFGYRLGRLERAGTRYTYPLALVRAQQVTGRRHVIVGNAAHGLHPVAGQGFNLGLRDAAVLAEVVADAVDGDPGDARVLRRYADWRREDHRRAVGLTDGLIRLFTSSVAPVRLARSAGLIALELLPAPRAALARQTMGLAGHVPRLARGVPLR